MNSIKGLPAGSMRCLRYVGSKIRMSAIISEVLQSSGAEALVDLFGGSGAVIMNAGFEKRVYNDLDSDIVHFFRTIANPEQFPKLLSYLEALPMSREIFEEGRDRYVNGGNSFHLVRDPIERAAMVFYRSSFSFGGKIKNGGFAVSLSDRSGIKELKRYHNVLQELEDVANFWRSTVIENMDYARIVNTYGNKEHVIIYADPPYFGTEDYYSRDFSSMNHSIMAGLLNKCACKVVISYYRFEGIEDLYPSPKWTHIEIEGTKNSMGRGGDDKEKSTELLICNFTPVKNSQQEKTLTT